jgi:hypothetical protein
MLNNTELQPGVYLVYYDDGIELCIIRVYKSNSNDLYFEVIKGIETTWSGAKGEKHLVSYFTSHCSFIKSKLGSLLYE